MGKSRGEEKELIGKEQRFQANAVELMRLSFETKCPQPVARQRETPNIQLIVVKLMTSHRKTGKDLFCF